MPKIFTTFEFIPSLNYFSSEGTNVFLNSFNAASS
ncbi:hypothetical protein NT07LI_3487, partial [Listeria innocua FSL S4-378]